LEKKNTGYAFTVNESSKQTTESTHIATRGADKEPASFASSFVRAAAL